MKGVISIKSSESESRSVTKVKTEANILPPTYTAWNSNWGQLKQMLKDRSQALENVHRLRGWRMDCEISKSHTGRSSSSENLSQGELELELYRRQMTEQRRDLENYRFKVIQLNKESKARQCLLWEAQSARIEAEKKYRNCQAQLEEMTQIKEEQKRQIEALTEQLFHVMEERNWYKNRITDDCVENVVNISPKPAYDATGEIREHLSQLEERLDAFEPTMMDVQDLDCAIVRSDHCSSVLSEPDSTLGDSLMSVAPLPLPDSVSVPSANVSTSFESVTDGVHLAESERPLGAGDIQMGSLYVSDLLHERNLLTTRLETMRTRLADLKNQWRESLVSLENQVVHLNQKITRDAEHYVKQHEEDQTLIKHLKHKISGLQCEIEQAHDTDKKNKMRLSEQSTEIAMKEARWLDKQVLLDSTIDGLKEHAQQIAVERDEAMQNIIKLECQLNYLQDALKSANDFLIKREEDLELSQCQIEDVTVQLNPPTLEQTDCKGETISASSHESNRHQESSSVTDDRRQSTTAQFVNERLQQKDRLIRLQRKQLKELQRMCTELIQNTQTTVSEGSKLNKNSRLSDRVDWFPELRDPSRLNRLTRSKINEHHMADELRTMIESDSQGLSRSSSDSVVSPTNPGQFDSNFNKHILIDHVKSDYFRPVEMKSQCEIMPAQSVIKVTAAEDLQGTDFSLDSISWNYLRHVVIKFILSREREAVHLIRVLSTLLRLTADEEYLLRRALHSRCTWWPRSRGFCHVLPNSLTHGQFAKIIPPS